MQGAPSTWTACRTDRAMADRESIKVMVRP
jgi:hypothetical protein